MNIEEKNIKNSEQFSNSVHENKKYEEYPAIFQFPREFRRNWLKQIDMRYLIILFITFFIQVSLLLIGLASLKNSAEEIDVNGIQKQYAHLLLDKNIESDFSFLNSEQQDTYLYGVPEEVEPEPEPILTADSRSGETSLPPTIPEAAQKSGDVSEMETDAPERSTSVERRMDRLARRNNMSDELSSQGILAYVNEGESYYDENLQEILKRGEENSKFLEQSATKIKLTSYSSNDIAEAEEVEINRLIKGSKSESPVEDMISSHERLEKAEFESVNKNTVIEEISSTNITKAAKKGLVRKPDHVTRIVNSHNRSIQDCFKQVLKKTQDTKGKVVVRFSVAPNGHVSAVKILKSTIDNDRMLRCIVSRISRWRDFGECDPELGEISYRQTYVFGY